MKEINPSTGMLGYLHTVNLNHFLYNTILKPYVFYMLLHCRGYMYIHKGLYIFKHSFEL